MRRRLSVGATDAIEQYLQHVEQQFVELEFVEQHVEQQLVQLEFFEQLVEQHVELEQHDHNDVG